MNRTAPRSSAFPHGGYYTLRGAESWAMGRCHTYRDRPGQMDALHVDLWWRGQNVLCDTGSYQYFTPRDARLAAHFLSRAAHNTVQIDGVDPATRVSPFLWFPWPRGRLLRHVPKSSDGLRLLACESLDYARRPWRVLHRRTVIGLPDDLWIIVDDLLGSGTHTSVLRWHAMDAPTTFDAAAGTLLLDTPAGPFGLSVVARPAMRAGETAALPGSVRVECARGVNTPERVQGWQSPYYGELRPSPTLEATVRAAGPVRFVTVARPGAPVAAVCEGYEVRVERWRIPVPEDHEKIGLSLSPVSQELHVTP